MSREAMKLALEALVLNNDEWKYLADSGDSGYWKAEDQGHYQLTNEAITALREALAEQPAQQEPWPENPAAPVQQEVCPTCGEYEPRTGNCGTSPNDKRALCNRNAPQPAQQQEPVAIKWTLDGDKTCGYNNWLGETPFGRILITWKGWKKYHDACVDEFPGDFSAYGSPDEVKAMCEAEFAKRSGYTSPPASKPWVGLEPGEISKIATSDPLAWANLNTVENRQYFARAIEAKLKEKNT